MPTYGLTPSGFVPKTVDVIESDIEASIHANLDPNYDLSPDTIDGQMKSAVASAAAEIWELIDVLYAQIDPNNAEGIVLDGNCQLTGTTRLGATAGHVVCAMGLNGSTTVPAGSLANVAGQPTNTWQLVGTGDPTSGALLVAGPVTSTTAGTYYGYFQSTSTGPVVANAGTLTVITNSVSGWNTVTNANNAVLGTNGESDAALNIRREEELAAAGSGTVDAIRAALLQVTGVIQAIVQENKGDSMDTNGNLPHSIRAIIWDGFSPAALNSSIAQTIWSNKPSGTGMNGAVTVTVNDSHGDPHAVQFDRASGVNYYVAITVKTDSTFDVVNGPAAIQAALTKESALAQNLGTPVYYGGPLRFSAFVQGVVSVTSFAIGLAPSPTGTTDLTMSATQIASLAGVAVTVT